MYVSLLPVVEACVVVAVPGRVGEVRVAADEPEAVDLDPGVLARRLDLLLERDKRWRVLCGAFALEVGLCRLLGAERQALSSHYTTATVWER